jgi:hypothetical protein
MRGNERIGMLDGLMIRHYPCVRDFRMGWVGMKGKGHMGCGGAQI